MLKNILVDIEKGSCQHCTGKYRCTNGCIAQRLIAHDTDIFEKDPHCVRHSGKLGGTLPENNKLSNITYSKEGVIDAGYY